MKIIKKLLPFVILIAVALMVFDFFHVTGSEIRNVKKLTEASYVDVGEGSLSIVNKLNEEQVEALKELLLETTFTRKIRKTIIGPLPECRYSILADWNDGGKTNLYIHLIGGEYAQVGGQFGDAFLKIKNPEFEYKLIEIMEMKQVN